MKMSPMAVVKAAPVTKTGRMMGIWVFLISLLYGPASIAAEQHALPWGPTPSAATAYARAEAIATLGQKLFFDPALSGSGRIACAGCHDPAYGFSAPNARSVQLGGTDLRRAGIRAVPGLMYGQNTPPFSEHFHESEDEGDESVDQGPPAGGIGTVASTEHGIRRHFHC